MGHESSVAKFDFGAKNPKIELCDITEKSLTESRIDYNWRYDRVVFRQEGKIPITVTFSFMESIVDLSGLLKPVSR
jgi:hypothetical protein